MTNRCIPRDLWPWLESVESGDELSEANPKRVPKANHRKACSGEAQLRCRLQRSVCDKIRLYGTTTGGVHYLEFILAGVLACLDGYMNIALEQTEEYVNGQLKNKYGDAFIRGNNGKSMHMIYMQILL